MPYVGSKCGKGSTYTAAVIRSTDAGTTSTNRPAGQPYRLSPPAPPPASGTRRKVRAADTVIPGTDSRRAKISSADDPRPGRAPYGRHGDQHCGSSMIQAHGLTKLYGDKTAVDHLDFTVRPGIVTGFLGPNGAGKSTTMRMILGLDRPSAGAVTVNGKAYADLPAPLHEVGALLEARSVHTGRSAYNHLRVLAATHGIAASRVARGHRPGRVGRRRATAEPAGSPSAWASAWASPPPCSATRAR